VIDNFAQVAGSGSACGATSQRLGFLVGTREPIDSDSIATFRCTSVPDLPDSPDQLRVELLEFLNSTNEGHSETVTGVSATKQPPRIKRPKIENKPPKRAFIIRSLA
jgi:hypothetical protein